MGINIMKEIEERARKIEYVSIDRGEAFDFQGIDGTADGAEVTRRRLDEISGDIRRILSKINEEDIKKQGEAVFVETTDSTKSLILLYNYIKDINQSLEEGDGDSKEILDDILQKFDKEFSELGIAAKGKKRIKEKRDNL